MTPKSLKHLSRSALCILLAACLCCSCTTTDPESCIGSPSAPSSTETQGTVSPLDDGRLRILYGSDNSANGSTVLYGSKVVYQGTPSESLSLIPDSLTGEVAYYWRQWSDESSSCRRRSALYDANGSQLLAFDKDYNASLTNGILVLSGALYSDDFAAERERCRLFDLASGQELPTPDGAYSCIVSGDALVFSCYTRPEELVGQPYDEDRFYHTTVIVTDFAGNVRLEKDHCFASKVYGSSAVDPQWLQMEIYEPDYLRVESALYNPSTGEWLTGYEQTCSDGIFCFDTGSGHQLVDLSGEEPVILGTFDAAVAVYAPGIAVLWNQAYSAENYYELYDLASGDVYRLADYSASDDRIAVYLQEDLLRIYDRNTGELLSENRVGSTDPDNTYLYFENSGALRVDQYGSPSTTCYFNSSGPLSGLNNALETYDTVCSLTTAEDGSCLYWARYEAPGKARSLFDVLDEQGNVLVSGLSSCYCYYDTALQSLPKGAFVAQKGFYYGWMDASGEWLYCRSIFSSVTADENADYFF